MAYKISKKANTDINNIWIYTAENWSVEQADRYYNLILDEIEYIDSHFEAGRILEHLKPGYRSTKVKSHIIFYQCKKDNVIEIVRVLHQSMDIENRLEE